MQLLIKLLQKILHFFAAAFSAKSTIPLTKTKNMEASTPSLQFAIIPGTVYYNPEQGIESKTDINITITNNGQTVQVSEVGILIPANLYLSGSANSIAPSASSNWDFLATDDLGVFKAIPQSGKSVTFMANSTVIFTLNTVTLAQQSTSTLITVKVVFADGTSIMQTAPVVVAQGAPGINSFSAEPANINPGQTSVLSWETTGVDYCVISPIGTNQLSASGSLEISPEAAVNTYTLNAYVGQTILTSQTTINVLTPTVIQFGVVDSPTQVDYGSYITLVWECSPSTLNIELTCDDIGLTIPPNLSPGPGQVYTTVGPITQITNFQLTPYGWYNNNSYNGKTLLITVNPPTVVFTASTTTDVWEHDAITLQWTITNAASVTITPALANGPSLQNLSGSVVINPVDDVDYTITVVGVADTTVTGNVNFPVSKVAITSFTVTPNPIVPDTGANQVTLAWATQGQVVSLSSTPGTVQPTGSLVITSPPANVTYALTAGTNQNPALLTSSIPVVNSYGPYQFNQFAPGQGFIDFTITNPVGLENLKDFFTGWYTIEITGAEIVGGLPAGFTLCGFSNYTGPQNPPTFFVGLFPPGQSVLQFEWTNPVQQTGTITILSPFNP